MHVRESGIVAVLARVTRRALPCALLAIATATATASARDPITPLADVHRGLHCTARTVVQGTEISTFDVDVLDVIDGGPGIGRYILVRVSGPAVDRTGIAEGFSGSPVFCPDAHGRIGNAGAISATIGEYGNGVGLVTPIEDMLPLRARPIAGVRHAPRVLPRGAHPIASPLMVAGLSPRLGGLLERAARRAGRTLVAVPAGPLGTFPAQELVPGASVSVMLSRGAITLGGVGTVTYRDGAKVWAFGHPLDGAGRRSLLLGDAYVFTVVANPLIFPVPSYKLALPGHALGTLSNDALTAVVGTVGQTPAMVPVTVRVRDLDLGRTLIQRTEVADEVDVGNPDGMDVTTIVASLAVMVGVDEAFNGSPAQESGRMCVRATLRGAKKPLRFCNRYVADGGADEGTGPLSAAMSEDVSIAVAAIAQARYAKLHVTGITADATISRGLRLATMLAAHGPRNVRPGQVVPIALKTRLVRGPLRTFHTKLRIPRDARPGRRALVLAGASPEGGGGFFGMLFGFFEEGGGGGGPAQSFDELAAAFADVARYDGITAHLGKADEWHAYRDPRLRIDGHAILPVRVVAPKHGHGG